MPEGDTIFRAAAQQRAALAGRTVTAVRTTVPQVRRLVPERLVGQTIRDVESRGKHLLHWFEPSGLALHTHLRMSGSWRLFRHRHRWTKPAGHARLVLETDEVVSVAFSVPVARHEQLASLGPDPLADPAGPVDLAEARRRLDARADQPIGVALLDQRVLAGVGNVYKNEVLFIHGVDPWDHVEALPGPTRDALLRTACDLLRANVLHGGLHRITTRPAALVQRSGPRGRDAVFVYGKAGRACPRCGAGIRSAPLGDHARITYWCPR